MSSERAADASACALPDGGACAHYFAYGSNMNPARVAARGLRFTDCSSAVLHGARLVFHKSSGGHPGEGHACFAFDRQAILEGVLYRLDSAAEILKMDRFEAAPFNYSRELIVVMSGERPVWTWTYFANPAVIRPNLRPSRAYLEHLLLGRPYLSDPYYRRLAAWPCCD
jgi:hypothetical protein